MTPTLVVETSDLAAAAHTLSDTVGDRLFSKVGSALDDAMACTGMAGDDPAGVQWSQAYGTSATAAAKAAEDVINGAYSLASLLSATAQNYARADATSTIGARHAVDDLVAGLPTPAPIALPARFRDVGGGLPNEPFGWSRVAHYVGLVWPNGHQDRLLRAAAAWHRSAGVLSGAAYDVELTLVGPLVDGLPEWCDIRTSCWSLSAQLHRVATAHRALGLACVQYAHHLDVAHSSVEHEIRTFLEQSAAIEVVGNLLAAATVGVAEIPTQGLEGARVSATVARIAHVVLELATAVRELVETLPIVEQLCDAVGAGMRDLLGVRVVWADVAGVSGLRVLSIARDGRASSSAADAGGEIGAIARLTDDADLPSELRAALDSRGGSWNRARTLGRHFDDHGADFGSTSESDYASKAREFFQRGTRGELEVKVDAKTGDILMYDRSSNTFGSFTRDGGARTYFKPDSADYFNSQRGRRVSW